MGLSASHIERANFEDIQQAKTSNEILINTMSRDNQDCLIKGTYSYIEEEKLINDLIKQKMFSKRIFIYGRNTNDYSGYEKFFQLQKIGFTNVYLYIGGLFEWLCLQDIYGDNNFPTTKLELDIYKYKPHSTLNVKRITN